MKRSDDPGGWEARSTQQDAEELRHKLVSKLGLALMVGAGVGWTTVGAVSRFDRSRFSVLLVLFILGTLTFLLSLRHSRLARSVLLIGPTLGLALALRSLDNPLVPAFGALTVIANAAVSPLLGLLAAILNTISLYALLPQGELLILSVVLLWIAAGIQWFSMQGLYTVLQWTSVSQQRASRLLADVRARRGELRRTLHTLTEATWRLERTRHELAVARKQAEEAHHIKAQFAANISHELRTPLNLIMGFSEMMYRTPEVYGKVSWSPTLRADIREIYRSANHLMGMVDDILDLSRIEAERLPLKLETTDLGELVRDAVDTASGLIRGKEVSLETVLPPDIPTVLVDRTRIRQVLLNLLNNAIRFTDRGRITVRAEEGEGEVVIAVADTGVGIPPDQMATIFEEFGQVKGPITSGRGGAGLGLAICKQFVRLHGGHINAESELGRGSVFRFTIPLPDSGRAQPRLSFYTPRGWSPRAPENPLGKTAIVIGPDMESGASLARAIQGYRALPTSNLEGLANTVEAEHPAGIVLLREPYVGEAPDLEQVWRAAGRSDLPIVKYEVPMDKLVSRELGIAEYLVKPIQREQLASAIRRACPGPTRFLVVDDDAGFVALVGRILTAEFQPVRVCKAYSGEEALEFLAQERFDVLLLDLILPGASGLQVIEAARRDTELSGLAVVVTTGSSYAEEVTRLRPERIELLRHDGCSKVQAGRYIRALLDVAPPNYSRPAPLEQQPAPLPVRQVS